MRAPLDRSSAARQCWESLDWPALREDLIAVQVLPGHPLAVLSFSCLQEEQQQQHPSCIITWKVAVPFLPDADRRRIATQLVYAEVKSAMSAQGAAHTVGLAAHYNRWCITGVDYKGGPLFRQESYNPKFRCLCHPLKRHPLKRCVWGQL